MISNVIFLGYKLSPNSSYDMGVVTIIKGV
jgi:hypothetical protein